MKKLKVITRFEVTTTQEGKIFANEGDTIIVSNRDAEHYNIHKVNDTLIFSRWMRKKWIEVKCK
jgi:hypothetical protein